MWWIMCTLKRSFSLFSRHSLAWAVNGCQLLIVRHVTRGINYHSHIVRDLALIKSKEMYSSILLCRTKIWLYLYFSNSFGTKRIYACYWSNRKCIITIRIWFNKTSFRNRFLLCVREPHSVVFFLTYIYSNLQAIIEYKGQRILFIYSFPLFKSLILMKSLIESQNVHIIQRHIWRIFQK